jgi:hypothetical protein
MQSSVRPCHLASCGLKSAFSGTSYNPTKLRGQSVGCRFASPRAPCLAWHSLAQHHKTKPCEHVEARYCICDRSDVSFNNSRKYQSCRHACFLDPAVAQKLFGSACRSYLVSPLTAFRQKLYAGPQSARLGVCLGRGSCRQHSCPAKGA